MSPTLVNPTLGLSLAGALLHAHLDGALLWGEEETLIVADLHLEKGSSFAGRARPQFVPPYDTRTTIDRLERLLMTYAPRRVICLGDSVHDQAAADADERRGLRENSRDDRLVRLDLGCRKSRSRAAVSLGRQHPAGGCHRQHPVAPSGSLWGAGCRRRRDLRAFPSDGVGCNPGGESFGPLLCERRGKRLILPAFGSYAGGLNVLDPAITRLFDRTFTVAVLGRRRMFAFPNARLLS